MNTNKISKKGRPETHNSSNFYNVQTLNLININFLFEYDVNLESLLSNSAENSGSITPPQELCKQKKTQFLIYPHQKV